MSRAKAEQNIEQKTISYKYFLLLPFMYLRKMTKQGKWTMATLPASIILRHSGVLQARVRHGHIRESHLFPQFVSDLLVQASHMQLYLDADELEAA